MPLRIQLQEFGYKIRYHFASDTYHLKSGHGRYLADLYSDNKLNHMIYSAGVLNSSSLEHYEPYWQCNDMFARTPTGGENVPDQPHLPAESSLL